jgi:hypothetical protein
MSQFKIFSAVAAVSLPLAAVALLSGSARSAPSRIAGTFAAKYTAQHPLPVNDAAGHALVLAQARGVNRSTGPTRYMDQGHVTNVEFADLIQGNGPQQGYISMGQGADTMISKWSGKVTTTLSPEKTPITTFEGTWTKVQGTGHYRDVRGKGDYKGRFTSQTEYTVEWTGEISGERITERTR